MSQLEFSEQVILEPRSASRATTRKTEKKAPYAIPTRSRTSQATRGRMTAEEFASNLQHYQRRRRSVSSQGHQQLRDRTAPQPKRPGIRAPTITSAKDDFSTISDVEDEGPEESGASQELQLAYRLAQSERLQSTSRMQLLRDADTFQNHRIRSVARDLVDRWCYAAVEAKDQHEHMERLASARDTEVLLRQAFQHWRLRLHANRKAITRERYFRDIERRLHEARNVQTLDIYFNHWRQWAFYHAARTSRARRHILRVKYFKTWRNISVSNQLKALGQGQRKHFLLWKQRYIHSLEDNNKASLVRQASLSRNAYWDWFWAFCERRAPEWQHARLKRKYFLRLIIDYSSIIRQDQLTTIQWENSLQRKALLPWLAKARLIISSQREAATFSHQKLLARTLPTWRQDTRHSPLARHVSNIVDWRVARVTFTTFMTRYHFEKQAKHVDRLRIIRNQWTRWNDRLRCQALSHRIDERCLYEALSRWTAVCRANFIYKLCLQRLQRKCLHKLEKKCLRRKQRREARCQTMQTVRHTKNLRVCFSYWRSQLTFQRQAEVIAFEFYAPKIAQDSLQTWFQYLAYQRNLEASAKDADFYFIGRKLLKRWHTAFVDSKKQRRRTAYVQVRRGLKMRLAAGVVQHWHRYSVRIHEMQQEADTIDQTQLFRVGINLFDCWKTQLATRRGQEYQAIQHYDRRLVERSLYTWIERLEDQARMDETADLNNEMHVRNIAFTLVHKLRLKIIEQKGREANAENLSNWYDRRHFHNMLRQWQNRTAKARSQPPPQIIPAISSRVSRTRKLFEGDDYEAATDRAEDWTEFDIGDWIPTLEAQSSSTPLPGYLSTPSKRAARAKALVRVSTTPAGTPFEHRLRSQLGPTPRTGRRTGFGRSVGPLRGSMFSAILEDSPRTPGV